MCNNNYCIWVCVCLEFLLSSIITLLAASIIMEFFLKIASGRCASVRGGGEFFWWRRNKCYHGCCEREIQWVSTRKSCWFISLVEGKQRNFIAWWRINVAKGYNRVPVVSPLTLQFWPTFSFLTLSVYVQCVKRNVHRVVFSFQDLSFSSEYIAECSSSSHLATALMAFKRKSSINYASPWS